MNKRITRAVAMFLSFMMILTLLPLSALAEGDGGDNNAVIEETENDGTEGEGAASENNEGGTTGGNTTSDFGVNTEDSEQDNDDSGNVTGSEADPDTAGDEDNQNDQILESTNDGEQDTGLESKYTLKVGASVDLTGHKSCVSYDGKNEKWGIEDAEIITITQESKNAVTVKGLCVGTAKLIHTYYVQDGDGNVVEETETAEITVEFNNIIIIMGIREWNDIENDIENLIAEGEKSVQFQGYGNDAKIAFPSDSDKVSFDYDVTFDNVCLEANYAYNASTTNTGKSGCFIKLFANGHDFVATKTVTTIGRVRVFGGGNETSVKNTNVNLNGGDYDLVVGGSYANAAGSDSQGYGETLNKVTANACTIYIGPEACAKGVVGGCLGGVNTGDITVTYASQKSGNVFVSGSSADAIKEYAERSLANSASRVDNPGGTITVIIAEGAIAGNVQGTMYSNVDVGNVNVINNGTVTNIYGCVGSNDVYVSSLRLHYAAYGVYPGWDYYDGSKVKRNYEVNANVNITNNGTVSSTIYGGYYDANIRTVNIVNNGTTEYIYGGGYEGIYVTDSINVEVGESGTAEYVFGGGKTGSWAIYGNLVCKNIKVAIYGTAGCVFGGGHDRLTTGNVTVDIYGVVSDSADNKAVSGGVYGGGWVTSTTAMQTSGDFLDGTATVTIHPDAAVAGNVCGGAVEGTATKTNVYVYGTVNGDVYGGGWTQEGGKVYPISYSPLTLYYFGMVGDSYVEVGKDAAVGSVYGGGQMANVTSNSAVVIKDNATVNGDVCGAGNPYTNFYYGSTLYTFSSNTRTVNGDASVTIQNNATIAGTIYGYRALDSDEDYDYVKGTETVTFDGAQGTYKHVMTAESVVVTNKSDVTIDNNGNDYAQIEYVSDLTIDNGGKLTLPSSAYITGNYTGDTEYTDGRTTDNRGALALAAGKLLYVGGTISGWTKLSIFDDENTGTTPAKAQVYVISEAGSDPTDENAGKFTWIDQRNNVKLKWNETLTISAGNRGTDDGVPVAAEEAGDDDKESAKKPSQWWLVDNPSTSTSEPGGVPTPPGGETTIDDSTVNQVNDPDPEETTEEDEYLDDSTVENVNSDNTDDTDEIDEEENVDKTESIFPGTGDAADVVRWILIMLLCAAGAIVLFKVAARKLQQK